MQPTIQQPLMPVPAAAHTRYAPEISNDCFAIFCGYHISDGNGGVDCEVLWGGILCMCCAYSSNRQRSGLSPAGPQEQLLHCDKSTCAVLAPWLIVYIVFLIFSSTSGAYHQDDFMTRDDYDDSYTTFPIVYLGDLDQYYYSYLGDYSIECLASTVSPYDDSTVCTELALETDGVWYFWPAQALGWCFNIYLAALFAANRIALQKRLGFVDPYRYGAPPPTPSLVACLAPDLAVGDPDWQRRFPWCLRAVFHRRHLLPDPMVMLDLPGVSRSQSRVENEQHDAPGSAPNARHAATDRQRPQWLGVVRSCAQTTRSVRS